MCVIPGVFSEAIYLDDRVFKVCPRHCGRAGGAGNQALGEVADRIDTVLGFITNRAIARSPQTRRRASDLFECMGPFRLAGTSFTGLGLTYGYREEAGHR